MNRRELLQSSSSASSSPNDCALYLAEAIGGDGRETPQDTPGNVVALIVIVSVAILFVFKICLCMVRVSRAEREAQRAEMEAVQSRLRARRIPPPPLPVLFVNPAGHILSPSTFLNLISKSRHAYGRKSPNRQKLEAVVLSRGKPEFGESLSLRRSGLGRVGATKGICLFCVILHRRKHASSS